MPFVCFISSNLAERLRRRRSSVELAMNIYPGDLLVQEHHKKLLKRNTVSDFHVLRNGSSSTNVVSEGIFYIMPVFFLREIVKLTYKIVTS